MGEPEKDCEKLAFMTESDSREAILRDLVMPDLLQQAFHEVRVNTAYGTRSLNKFMTRQCRLLMTFAGFLVFFLYYVLINCTSDF